MGGAQKPVLRAELGPGGRVRDEPWALEADGSRAPGLTALGLVRQAASPSKTRPCRLPRGRHRNGRGPLAPLALGDPPATEHNARGSRMGALFLLPAHPSHSLSLHVQFPVLPPEGPVSQPALPAGGRNSQLNQEPSFRSSSGCTRVRKAKPPEGRLAQPGACTPGPGPNTALSAGGAGTTPPPSMVLTPSAHREPLGLRHCPSRGPAPIDPGSMGRVRGAVWAWGLQAARAPGVGMSVLWRPVHWPFSLGFPVPAPCGRSEGAERVGVTQCPSLAPTKITRGKNTNSRPHSSPAQNHICI